MYHRILIRKKKWSRATSQKSLERAFNAAGIETQSQELQEGGTSYGTQPIKITYDAQQPNIEEKLKRAVKMAKGQDMVTRIGSNWSVDQHNSGLSRKLPVPNIKGPVVSLEQNHIAMEFTGENAYLRDANRTNPREMQATGGVSAALIPQLTTMLDRLTKIGVNPQSVRIEGGVNKDEFQPRDSIKISVPLREVERIADASEKTRFAQRAQQSTNAMGRQ